MKNYIFSQKNTKLKVWLIIVASLLLSCSGLKAQSWWAVGKGLGFYNRIPYVYSLLSYDSVLFVSGDFDSAGGQPATAIAQWDGVSWSNLEKGLQYWGGGGPLAMYNGKLYVGGWFDTAGGIACSGIASWDGAHWSGVGVGSPPGIRPLTSLVNGSGWINALCVYQGELYAGGYFDSIGGIAALHIARWNGTKWDSVGSGIEWRIDWGVSSLAVYNGKLYVGGLFNAAGGILARNIATWDGTKWDSAGIDTRWDGDISKLYMYDSLLFVSGAFDYRSAYSDTQVGYNLGVYITQWNGSNFDSLCPPKIGPNNGADAFDVYNGKLYVGGVFDSAGGLQVNGIATWDSSHWGALGSGMSCYGCGGEIEIYCIAHFKGDIYAGGDFDTAGGKAINGLARWGLPTGNEEIKGKSEDVKVEPNPTAGKAELRITNYELGMEYSLEVFNVFGQRVYSSFTIHHSPFTIDLSSNPDGVYFYRVVSEKGNEIGSGKMVKIN